MSYEPARAVGAEIADASVVGKQDHSEANQFIAHGS
jgi:hypothetical protein